MRLEVDPTKIPKYTMFFTDPEVVILSIVFHSRINGLRLSDKEDEITLLDADIASLTPSGKVHKIAVDEPGIIALPITEFCLKYSGMIKDNKLRPEDHPQRNTNSHGWSARYC
jgi:hypothetical protein